MFCSLCCNCFFFLLQNNQYVSDLDLSDNDLQSDGVASISEMLAENQAITHLVSKSIICCIFPHFSKYTFMNINCKQSILFITIVLIGQHLIFVLHILLIYHLPFFQDLSENKLSEAGFKSICTTVAHHDILKVLKLSGECYMYVLYTNIDEHITI